MGKDINELARQERQEYFRKWRAANKERVKKYNSSYWERKALKIIEDEVKGDAADE